MSQSGWAVELNDENPDPRVSCVVLADVSGSMQGAPIAALESGYASFTQYLNNDVLASKRVEVAVVTFGTVATVLVPMQEARGLQPTRFTASGRTNMAAGVHLALDIIEDRKAAYKAAGLQYYRPWILLLTDGQANQEGFDEAVARLNATEAARGVTIFAVGAGPHVDWQQLSRLSIQRGPAPLDGLKYEELFEWLSASLSNVSNSTEFARTDEALAGMGQQISLPPLSGWASV
ncbi:VWA domain-containing protein [Mycobacterium frederiksbergense]|uniref:vWA domain-containing protein n=1 Tax=Mycolicibacterium frederiksbergense TaxID=117567 RepID=UPI0021F392FB|nr:VWA domain-containing protein [Mycolicibacterium frederiksbergense]MCV7044738.1 VWA domain-containing protein [Mycolicibacterium frederiksbergense]